MTSNLELLEELKREYDPKTAFGNPVILDIMKKFHYPNKAGRYEIEGEIEEIVRVSYRCSNCGAYEEEDDICHSHNDYVNTECRRCKSKLRINF